MLQQIYGVEFVQFSRGLRQKGPIGRVDGSGYITPLYTFLDAEVTCGKGRVVVRQENGVDRGRQGRGNDAQLDRTPGMVVRGEDVSAATWQQTVHGNAPKEDRHEEDTTIS